jgi:hypothetical protein
LNYPDSVTNNDLYQFFSAFFCLTEIYNINQEIQKDPTTCY